MVSGAARFDSADTYGLLARLGELKRSGIRLTMAMTVRNRREYLAGLHIGVSSFSGNERILRAAEEHPEATGGTTGLHKLRCSWRSQQFRPCIYHGARWKAIRWERNTAGKRRQ